MPGPRRFPLPLIAAFFALYVIWGSTYLVIRIGVEYWPPLLLAGIRFCTAGALMYGFLRWRGVPAPTWKVKEVPDPRILWPLKVVPPTTRAIS